MHLAADYCVEGLAMPFDREEFLKQARKRILHDCTDEERLEGLTPEQRLAGLAPEQILATLTPEHCVEILVLEHPRWVDVQLRVALRLVELGAIDRLTSDLRKKLCGLLIERPPAQA